MLFVAFSKAVEGLMAYLCNYKVKAKLEISVVNANYFPEDLTTITLLKKAHFLEALKISETALQVIQRGNIFFGYGPTVKVSFVQGVTERHIALCGGLGYIPKCRNYHHVSFVSEQHSVERAEFGDIEQRVTTSYNIPRAASAQLCISGLWQAACLQPTACFCHMLAAYVGSLGIGIGPVSP
ncbi:hypothetical protein VNO78_12104 [Psophocarpus tetragonolobus]|uniref:Uncharacterized protein n=1 Tax=Psophocarpus tetragonolobus TaxID=3891 RepID=A0AAN9SMT3_PSOTE